MHSLLNMENYDAWDRFIPLRRAVTTSNFHHGILTNIKEQKDILDQDIINVNVEEYHRLLEIALGLEAKTARVYRFQRTASPDNEAGREFQWPVRSRRYPLIENPTAVLDLPGFKPCFNHNLFDWGPDYLAAALHTDVFLWNAGKQKGKKLTRVIPGYCSSLKWSNVDKQLAIGTSCGMVQFWNEKKLLKFFVCNHCCEGPCTINALAWHPYFNVLVSGCSKGFIGMYEKCQFYEAHESPISTLRFSPDGTFLASSGGDCAVRLWQWPHMMPHMEVVGETDCPIRALAWHPWYTSYLVIGETLWNVRLCCLLTTLQLGDVKVNGLEFNKITGELVVNIWKPGTEDQSTNGYSTALVLANCKDVVDKIDFNEGVVYQMMWDSSGQQLAAVGEDESLRIWNFFGSSSRRDKGNCFKSLLMPILPAGFKIPSKNGFKLYNGIVYYFEDTDKNQSSRLSAVYEHNFGYTIR